MRQKEAALACLPCEGSVVCWKRLDLLALLLFISLKSTWTTSWKYSTAVLPKTVDDVLLPQTVIKTLTDIRPYAIITTDVGQHQMWAARQYTKCKRRK